MSMKEKYKKVCKYQILMNNGFEFTEKGEKSMRTKIALLSVQQNPDQARKKALPFRSNSYLIRCLEWKTFSIS